MGSAPLCLTPCVPGDKRYVFCGLIALGAGGMAWSMALRPASSPPRRGEGERRYGAVLHAIPPAPNAMRPFVVAKLRQAEHPVDGLCPRLKDYL
jgi:hypothetical protein